MALKFFLLFSGIMHMSSVTADVPPLDSPCESVGIRATEMMCLAACPVANTTTPNQLKACESCLQLGSQKSIISCLSCVKRLGPTSSKRAGGCSVCYKTTQNQRACETCLKRGVQPLARCVGSQSFSNLTRTPFAIEFVILSSAMWDSPSIKEAGNRVLRFARSVLSRIGADPVTATVDPLSKALTLTLALETPKTVSYMAKVVKNRFHKKTLAKTFIGAVPCGYIVKIRDASNRSSSPFAALSCETTKEACCSSNESLDQTKLSQSDLPTASTTKTTCQGVTPLYASSKIKDIPLPPP